MRKYAMCQYAMILYRHSVAWLLTLTLFLFGGAVLFAQTHVSVPLGHNVYYLLDQAEARGLCSPLPTVKPYTRGRIVEAINEILAAEGGRFGGLSNAERRMLEDARAEFRGDEAGPDLLKGMYRFDNQGGKGIRFSGDLGIAVESLNSGAYYTDDDKTHLGTDTWVTVFFGGDVGSNFSFNVDFSGGIMLAERSYLGTYDTYATEFDEAPDRGNVNRRLDVYSQPLAFFPYSFQKNWDGYISHLGNFSASSMESWPEGPSNAARMLAEMSGNALGDTLFLRAGRLRREWGAMAPGSSLVFNASARPFIGVEAVFNPVPWFSFSSITGVLEFDSSGGIKEPALTFQNAFSLQQVELNHKNYFHFGFGSSTIWPKRFELGYLFPLLGNFWYQNFIGDFDNIGFHLNIRGRYPGLGGLWFSVFLDETEFTTVFDSAFNRDQHMFAYQAGAQGIIPGLSFASITATYTKIEPYNYTHVRLYTPWYAGDEPMETAYINNGISLGYYLPPNSDELKLRFDIRPLLKTAGHLQYQLIRHGADYGPHQVDGSSLLSELDPGDRRNAVSLRKSFLNDGAYRWMHIIKIGAEHAFRSLPITVFGEAGVMYSWFTDITDAEYARYNPAPSGAAARPPAEGEYSTSTAFIVSVGFRVFR